MNKLYLLIEKRIIYLLTSGTGRTSQVTPAGSAMDTLLDLHDLLNRPIREEHTALILA